MLMTSIIKKAAALHFPLKTMETQCVGSEGGTRSPLPKLVSSALQSANGKGLELN